MDTEAIMMRAFRDEMLKIALEKDAGLARGVRWLGAGLQRLGGRLAQVGQAPAAAPLSAAAIPKLPSPATSAVTKVMKKPSRPQWVLSQKQMAAMPAKSMQEAASFSRSMAAKQLPPPALPQTAEVRRILATRAAGA